MGFTHNVIFHNDMGNIKCFGAFLSNSGHSYRIVISVCDCYKNSCSCYREVVIPEAYVKDILQEVGSAGEVNDDE